MLWIFKQYASFTSSQQKLKKVKEYFPVVEFFQMSMFIFITWLCGVTVVVVTMLDAANVKDVGAITYNFVRRIAEFVLLVMMLLILKLPSVQGNSKENSIDKPTELQGTASTETKDSTFVLEVQ